MERKTRKLRNDLTGKTFGLLQVLGRSENRGNGKKPCVMYRCQCECGKIIEASSGDLINRHHVSCGCKKTKHLESYKHMTRLYNIWKCMRQRCNNPHNPSYPRYGGRGITICPEWNEYAVFRDWAMRNGYNDSLSIDRIDNENGYMPDNCRWADAKTQTNNTRRNHYINFHGEKRTMAEIARMTGQTYSTIQHRVDRGQPLERK